MRDRMVVGIVVAVIGGVVLACNVPAQGQEPETFCSIDYNQSGFIDIHDISELTGRFGTAQPPPYDVPPRDGYVSTVDLVELTDVFGLECYEATGDEEFTVGGQGETPLTLFYCQWATWHFPKIMDTEPPYEAIIATKGDTQCMSDNPTGYTSQCFTGTEVRYLGTPPQNPVYYVAGVSPPFEYGHTDDCYAYTGPFVVPMYRNIRDFVHHGIRDNVTGQWVHGPHDHHALYDTAVVH